MDGDPCACKDCYDAAPYDVPNQSTGAKIIARGRCALLNSGDGKRKDFVQEIESSEKYQGCQWAV
jgi:hypothetical protein